MYNQNQNHTTDILTLKNNNMMTYEEKLHELARMFMYQFPDLECQSLDEFLMDYREELTDEQYELGSYILTLFE